MSLKLTLETGGETKAQDAPKLSSLSCSKRNQMQSRACRWGRLNGKNSSENLEAGYWPWDIMTRKTSGIQILLSKHKRARGTQQNQESGARAQLISTSRCPGPWKP